MKDFVALILLVLFAVFVFVLRDSSNINMCIRAEKLGASIVWVQPKFLNDKCYIEVEVSSQVIRMNAEDWIQYFGEEK